MIWNDINKGQNYSSIDGYSDGNLIYIVNIMNGEVKSCNVFSETNPDNTNIIAQFRPKRKT